ncbi:hypothetical protein [Amycolatopsis benzoatilytica]|uniref:hypothetical protein n=1 Tax=Amycolatopsis benzoatilytica TaxID=346045 RepID=UPI000399BE53|nr:hypothetical protein [Amycolatopsis benzoatilytica]
MIGSPAANADTLVRVGILALPLGNALKLVGNLGTFNSVGYGVPAAAEAAVAAGPGYFLGNLAGSITSVLFGLFGLLALFGFLVRRASRRLVVPALVCSVLGTGFTLAALGVITYAIPALAHAYQAGNPAAMTVADGFFVWPWGAMLYPAVLVPIGLVLFCTALWKSTTVSRAAIVAVAVSSVLISVPVPIHSIRLAGGVLGLLAGVWLAGVVRRDLVRSPR